MRIKHDRYKLMADRTLGRYFVDGQRDNGGFVLEDPVRDGLKIPKLTAIPAGVYRVRMRYSPKANETVPWLTDVPQFTWIEVHVGNTPGDTDGCLLVGESFAPVAFDLMRSRINFERLKPQIVAAEERHEDVFWEITESFRLTPTPEVM